MVLGGAMNCSLHTYNVAHAFEVQDRSSELLAISLRIRFDFTAKSCFYANIAAYANVMNL